MSSCEENLGRTSVVFIYLILYCSGDSGKLDLGEMCQRNVLSMLDDECSRDRPIHNGLDLSARNLSHHFHLGFAPVS